MSRVAATDLAPFLTTSPDYEETERLKAELRGVRLTRRPLFLKREDFLRICHWKLGSQYARVAKRIESNSDAAVRVITETAFRMTDSNEAVELRLRFGTLQVLHGVGMGIASAILALTYPEDYAVIDYRAWRQLFGETKSGFSILDYQKHLKEIVDLAVCLHRFPQEVDLALWAFDIKRGGIPLPEPPPPEAQVTNIDDDPFNADWIKFRSLDGLTPGQFLVEYGHGITSREFKCLPIYHFNKYRNQWIRDLEW